MSATRVVIGVALVTAVPLSAQAQLRPSVDVAGGYQLLNLQSDALDAAGVGTFFPVGWFGELAIPVSNGMTLVGHVAGDYRSKSIPLTLATAPPASGYGLKVHRFLTGVRVVGRRDDGLTAFFHLLVGPTRTALTVSPSATGSSYPTTDFTVQAGGGFDFPLRARWSGRVTADYVRLNTKDLPSHGLRVAVGGVVPLTRR